MLKQKFLGKMKIVIQVFFQMSMTIWVKSSASDTQSRAGPRCVPGNAFLAMLLKQKFLGMMKIIISGIIRMSISIWVMSRAWDIKELGTDPGVSQGMPFWKGC